MVAQLAVIAETLARAAERLAEALQQYSPAREAMERERETDTRDDVSSEAAELTADSSSPENQSETTNVAGEEIERMDQAAEADDDENKFS